MKLLLYSQKIVLEQRCCANKGCSNIFWAKKESPQSICSNQCLRLTHRLRPKEKTDSLPKPIKISKKQAQKIIAAKSKSEPKFVFVYP